MQQLNKSLRNKKPKKITLENYCLEIISMKCHRLKNHFSVFLNKERVHVTDVEKNFNIYKGKNIQKKILKNNNLKM